MFIIKGKRSVGVFAEYYHAFFIPFSPIGEKTIKILCLFLFSSAKLKNRMHYATGTSPLGPWKYQGIFMDPTDSYTNHGSIVEYKGQWYFFYHTSALSHFDWLRSICVDKLYYNPDGTIQKVIPTK